MQRIAIEWTDFTANPLKYRDASGRVVWACEKVPFGQRAAVAMRAAGADSAAAPTTTPARLAKVTPFLDEAELRRMLTAKRISGKDVAGARCFVGDMTDIFGEWVERWILAQLLGTMAVRYDVTWQVLTKRAERMRDLLSDASFRSEIAEWVEMLADGDDGCDPLARTSDDLRANAPDVEDDDWPLPNIWFGVSCEDQQRADERIPHLLQTPAAVRFISAEPLIAPIDLHPLTDDTYRQLWPFYYTGKFDEAASRAAPPAPDRRRDLFPRIDWVIVGGESGPGARPCDVAWIRSIVQQCQSADVPAFVKQIGAHPFEDVDKVDVTPHTVFGDEVVRYNEPREIEVKDRKGGDPSKWPEDLRVREFPRSAVPA